HLPPNCRKIAMSGDAPSVRLGAYLPTLPPSEPIVFFVGAMAHGPDNWADDVIDDKVSVSDYPLSASVTCGKLQLALTELNLCPDDVIGFLELRIGIRKPKFAGAIIGVATTNLMASPPASSSWSMPPPDTFSTAVSAVAAAVRQTTAPHPVPPPVPATPLQAGGRAAGPNGADSGVGIDGRLRWGGPTPACDRCREKKRRCDAARPECGACVRARRRFGHREGQ
ncbi:hypothetical protein HK405_000712, partial [Cladochytrium tenue]